MAAVSDLIVRLDIDLTGWQRAMARAVQSTDRLVLSLGRARWSADQLGRVLVVPVEARAATRCELAAQRRIDQAMRGCGPGVQHDARGGPPPGRRGPRHDRPRA